MAMAKAGQKFAASVSGDCGALVSVGVDGKRAGIDPATITLLITQIVLPLVKGLIERCRARREQQDSPQQQIAKAHYDAKLRAKNIDTLARRILAECRARRTAEIRKAKTTGLPADTGRYEMDADSAYRLADKMHSRFATMKASDAEALCSEYGVA
jgi:uncharacterized protein YqjF (DUF2071 family)